MRATRPLLTLLVTLPYHRNVYLYTVAVAWVITGGPPEWLVIINRTGASRELSGTPLAPSEHSFIQNLDGNQDAKIVRNVVCHERSFN